jgi:hypothetical protein
VFHHDSPEFLERIKFQNVEQEAGCEQENASREIVQNEDGSKSVLEKVESRQRKEEAYAGPCTIQASGERLGDLTR